MVPPSSHRVSRVRRYSGYSWLKDPFAYRILTFSDRPSHAVRLDSFIPWPLPRSLATTDGISVDFSSSPYLDVSVQAVPLIRLCIQRMMTRLLLPDCSIRKSTDIAPTYGSPWLIAVSHVLHRLSVPRHSPCALCSLTIVLVVSSQ